MAAFDNLIKTSRLNNLILNISAFVALCAFSWLGIHEFNSVNEMRHILNSDLKGIELQIESVSGAVNNSQPLQAEIQSHLSNNIQASHIVYAVILIAVIFLGLAWLFTFIHFRRLKNIKINEQRLEELLYYDQVSEIHANSPLKEQLPPAIREMQLNRNIFIAELQRALTDNQFILHYQPIINANNGKVVDIEALIRWQHPDHGLLSPALFLPLCEQNEFIIPLGEWVIRTACKQIKKWHDMGYAKLCISINLSARQLTNPDLLSFITNITTLNQLSPGCIKLEITENSIMKDENICVTQLKSLRQLGLQLSLDDFGTGYSSLNYLKQFPINNLKIDKSFIHDITTNITSLAIVESVITLGKSLGLTITAEGVENNTQLYMLKKMQCDLIQGYLYSKPVAAEELTRLLHDSVNKASVNNAPVNKARENTHSNKITDLPYDSINYRYDILKHEHYDQAVNVISHSFCEYEPMTKYLGLTHHEFIPFAKFMVDKAIKDGLSIVALDNDKVTACTIVEDIADPLNISIDIDPRFKIIFSLLENLGNDFLSERTIDKGHIAHLFITAVNKNHHGQGLSRKINFESIRLAKEKGFDFMCCEFTHDYNQKGTVNNLKNNRLLIRSCIYKDFIFDGKKPFENLDGCASAYIWELREGAKLRYHINA